MGVMADLDLQLQELSEVLREPVLSAEEQIERKCDWIIRELDELCALASHAETVDLLDRERAAVGGIVCRAQLIASLLMARKPSDGLRIVRN